MNEPIKLGDMVVLVKSLLGVNLGKIGMVRELGQHPVDHIPCALVTFPRPVPWSDGKLYLIGWVDVTWLRPLRDGPADDETLSWTPVPAEDLITITTR